MLNALAFLKDVRQTMSSLKPGMNLGSNTVFPGVQTLDGFLLGFMHPEYFRSMCRKHGLDPKTSEAVMMQADHSTDPHVHVVGRSVFLPLGIDDGFADCAGGTFLGPYDPRGRRFELTFEPAQAGEPFVIEPGVIHFLTPGEGSRFSARAGGAPCILKNDGSFDILRLGPPFIRVDGAKALVEAI